MMEFPSEAFLTALAAIVVVDLMLAGDNAVVIALAARSLPAPLQKRAILWGTAGAIAVRCFMTLIVVWLLAIPGMLFAGGAILVWIAYKLLVPKSGHSREGGNPDTTLARDGLDSRLRGNDGFLRGNDGWKFVPDTNFWAAMRTIVVADAVMGLDNMLAVGGAAQGSYALVGAGFLLSIPIVAWGSGMMLRLTARFPAIVYVGAGVIASIAADMIFSEPVVRNAAATLKPHRVALLYLLVIGGVIFAGLVRTHPRFKGYGVPATLGTLIALIAMALGD